MPNTPALDITEVSPVVATTPKPAAGPLREMKQLVSPGGSSYTPLLQVNSCFENKSLATQLIIFHVAFSHIAIDFS